MPRKTIALAVLLLAGGGCRDGPVGIAGPAEDQGTADVQLAEETVTDLQQVISMLNDPFVESLLASLEDRQTAEQVGVRVRRLAAFSPADVLPTATSAELLVEPSPDRSPDDAVVLAILALTLGRAGELLTEITETDRAGATSEQARGRERLK